MLIVVAYVLAVYKIRMQQHMYDKLGICKVVEESDSDYSDSDDEEGDDGEEN